MSSTDVTESDPTSQTAHCDPEIESNPDSTTGSPVNEAAAIRHENSTRRANDREQNHKSQTVLLAALILGFAVLIVAAFTDMYFKHEENMGKLKNDMEYRRLENEQKEIELQVKKLQMEKEMQALKNEKLKIDQEHAERMIILESERKMNETRAQMTKDLLTPQRVKRKKVDSGFFSSSTEEYDDIELPIERLKLDKQQFAALIGDQHSDTKTTREQEKKREEDDYI